MSNTERFTVEQVKAALEAGAGIYSQAAQLLKCAPNTVKNYVERYPELATACDEIVDINLDMAESMLLKKMSEGNLTALIFFLKCKGKHRGWVERYEASTPGDQHFVVQFSPADAAL